jgi:ABC-type sugar transport system ATPase subunit
MKDALISGQSLSKSFGATVALSDVSFSLMSGQVHGLIGENGAGKSTLAKILCGVHAPSTGELRLDGARVSRWTPEVAIAAGVVTVHQDVNLIETMTVTENIFLNAERTTVFGLNTKAMEGEAAALLASLDINVSPRAELGSLPTDLRKMVQLARAVRQRPKVLLLDEPTSSLTADEVGVLLAQVHKIAESGVGVLYISHYLNEVFDHTDHLTILRDGVTAWSGATTEITMSDAISQMIGARLRAPALRAKPPLSGPPALELRGMSLSHRLKDISFSVQPGEILGIGGLVGAGLSDLARAIFADPAFRAAGQVWAGGQQVHWSNPADAMNDGVALVTNDRHRSGALVDFSIADNITLPSLAAFTGPFGVLKADAMREGVAGQMAALGVKAQGPEAALSTLSGGNQQKVMLAKWFMTAPGVLILDEPTIGVDIGAKRAIKDLICAKADEGCAIVILTSEMEELAEIANRAIVMFRGQIVARFDTPGFSRADLTNAANTVSATHLEPTA